MVSHPFRFFSGRLDRRAILFLQDLLELNAVKHFVVHTIVFGLLLTACAGQRARAQAQAQTVFSVEVKNSDDQVSILYEQGTAFIEINSPSGIGSAKFVHESGRMPERIMARLHLQGLEEFRLISSDQNIISASIPGSMGIQAQSQRKVSENGELAIRSSDPLWLDIEIISDSQQIPLQDGYFEIAFPMEFIKQSGSSFEIRWIDFFR